MTARKPWFGRAGVAAATLFLMASPAAAEVAGSVDAGLQELAAQIVQKSTAADRTKIAILPFPNADKSCSVLSTYIVDELTLALFTVPNSKLTIVERAQLESLINELTIGEGGLLNPETTKELGKISGVQALAVGTITVIGDTLRINSRLVATDTGETVSAAAVNVPKTSAINDLLGQKTPCGTLIAGSANGGGKSSTAGTPPIPGTKGATPPMPMPVLPGNQFTTGDLTFSVQSASRSEDKKSVNVSFMVVNSGSEALHAMFIGPQAFLSDSQGNAALATHVSGMGICTKNSIDWEQQMNYCWDYCTGSLTTLMPQGQNLILMRFKIGEQKANGRPKEGDEEKPIVLSGDSVSFSSRLGVQKGEKGKPQGYSIGVANIPLK